MERYESYKDSGVKWLGEIPGHWEVRKAKYIWKEKEDISSNGRETLLSVSQYNGVVPNTETSRSESLIGYKIVENNNLVINIMLAWMGGLGVSRHLGIVSPAYCVYKTITNCDTRFLHYLYKTPLYLSEFARRSSGIVPSRWRMYTDDFGQVQTLLPPKSEQTAIANYLDSVTSKIDEAISQQQKMIDLLNERKQIIIQNAVTKGLDPNAKMKDSGVEWIGEIPEDWELKRFRFLFFENKCKNNKLKVKQQLQFNYGEIVPKERQDIDKEVSKIISNYTIVREKDIMINGLNLNYDFISQRVAMVRESGIITSAYISLRSKGNVNSNYYNYFLKAMDFRKIFHGMGSGIRLTLAFDNLKNLFFPYPNLNEQNIIANHLDSVTSKIDSSITQCNKMISLLQERKQIIINDVVTGKVKVV